MSVENIEDYLGAVYRLRKDPETPVRLSQLGDYFGFSPVSIHEMIQKLDRQGLVAYHPYRGAVLTPEGERQAVALVQRHRIWERFLTDMLNFSWDEAHALAENLEHAAPQEVTQRLARLLGNPEHCPHGGPIPPQPEDPDGRPLPEVAAQTFVEVLRVQPESAETLQYLQAREIGPRTLLRVLAHTPEATTVLAHGQTLALPLSIAQATWVLIEKSTEEVTGDDPDRT